MQSIIIDAVLLLCVSGLFIANRSQKKQKKVHKENSEATEEIRNNFVKSVEKITREQQQKLEQLARHAMSSERNVLALFNKINTAVEQIQTMEENIESKQNTIQVFNDNSSKFFEMLPKSEEFIEKMVFLCDKSQKYNDTLNENINNHNNIIQNSSEKELQFLNKIQRLENQLKVLVENTIQEIQSVTLAQKENIDDVSANFLQNFQLSLDSYVEEKQSVFHNYVASEQNELQTIVQNVEENIAEQLITMEEKKAYFSRFVEQQQIQLSDIKENSIEHMNAIIGKKQDQLNENLLEIENGMQSKIDIVKNSCDKNMQKIQSSINPLLYTFESIKEKVVTDQEEIAGYYKNIKEFVEEENKKLHVVYKDMGKNIENVRNDLDRVKTDMKTNLLQKIEDYSNCLDQEVKDKKEIFDQHVVAVGEYFSSMEKNSKDNIEKMIDKVQVCQEEKLIQYEHELDRKKEYCIEKYEQKSNEINEYFDFSVSELKNNIEDKKIEFETLYNDCEKCMKEIEMNSHNRIADSCKHVEQKFEDNIIVFEKELIKNLESKKLEIEDVGRNLEDRMSEIRKTEELCREQVKASQEKIEETLETSRVRFEEELEKNLEEYAQKYTGKDEALDDLFNEYVNNYREELESKKLEIEDVGRNLEDRMSEIRKTEELCREQVKASQEKIEETLETSRIHFEAELEKNLEEYAQKYTGKDEALDDLFNEYVNNYREELESKKLEIEDVGRNLEDRMSEIRKTEELCREQVKASQEKIEETLETSRIHFEAELEKNLEEYAQKYTGKDEALDDLFNEYVNNYREELESKKLEIEDVGRNLEDRMSEIRKTEELCREQVKASQEKIEETLETSRIHFEAELEKNLEEYAQKYTGKDEALDDLFNEYVNNYREELESKKLEIEDVGRNLEDRMSEIRKTEELCREQVKASQEKIEETLETSRIHFEAELEKNLEEYAQKYTGKDEALDDLFNEYVNNYREELESKKLEIEDVGRNLEDRMSEIRKTEELCREQVKASQEKIEETLETSRIHFEAELEKNLEEYAQKYTGKDEALDDLFNEYVNNYREELESKKLEIEDVGRNLEDRMSEIRKTEELCREQVKASQEKIEETLETSRVRFEEELEKNLEEYAQKYTGKDEALDDLFNEYVNNYREELESKKLEIEDVGRNLEDRMSEIRKTEELCREQVKASQEKIEETLETSRIHFEAELEKNLEEYAQKYTGKDEALDDLFNEYVNNYREELESKKLEIEDVGRNLEDRMSEIRKTEELCREHVKASQEKIEETLETSRIHFEAELEKNLEEYAQKYTGKDEALDDLFNEYVNNYREELESKKLEIEDVGRNLEDRMSEIRKTEELCREQVKASQEKIEETLETSRVRFEEELEKNLEEYAQKYTGKDEALDDLFNEYVNNYREELESKKLEIEDVGRNLEDRMSEIRKTEELCREQVKASQEKIEETLETSRIHFEAELEKNLEEYAQKYTGKDEALDDLFNEYVNNYREELESKKLEIEDVGRNLEDRMSEIRKTEELCREQVDNLYKSTQTRLEECEIVFEKDLEHLQYKNTKKIEVIQGEYVDLQSQVYDKVKIIHQENMQDVKNHHSKNIADVALQSEKILSDVKKYGDNVSLSVKKEIDLFEKRFETTQQDIESYVNEISEHVDVLSRKSVKQKELIEKDTVAIERLEKLYSDTAIRSEMLNQNILEMKLKTTEYEKLNNKLSFLHNHVGDIEKRITQVQSQEHELKKVIKNHHKLSKQIQKIDARTEKIDGLMELLQDKESKIIEIKDAVLDVQTTQKELKKYSGELEKSRVAYENALDDTHALEKNVLKLEKESNKIHQEMNDWEGVISDTSVKLSKIEGQQELVQKLSVEVQATVNNIPKITQKLQEITNAQQWVADLETRLQNLNREASQKLSLLSLVSNPSPENRSKGTRMTEKTKETIRGLYEHKYSSERIAQVLKLSVGEVEMVLGQTML